MTQKKRIYDLAKEYGLSGDDLVKKIKDRGTFSSVKGKMSSLDDFEVLQIQGMLEAEGLKPASVATATKEQPAATADASGFLKKKKKKLSLTAQDLDAENERAEAQEPAPRTIAPQAAALTLERHEPARAALESVELARHDTRHDMGGGEGSAVLEHAPRPATERHAPERQTPDRHVPTHAPTHAPVASVGAVARDTELELAPEAPAETLASAPAAELASAVAGASPVLADDVAAPESDAPTRTETGRVARTPQTHVTSTPGHTAPTGRVATPSTDEAALAETEPGKTVTPAVRKPAGKVVGFIDLSKLKGSQAKKPVQESRRLRSKDDVAPNVQPTLGHDKKKALVRGDRGTRENLTASQLREREAGRFLRRSVPLRPGQQLAPGQAPQRFERSRGREGGVSPYSGTRVDVEIPVTLKKLAEVLSVKPNEILSIAMRGFGMFTLNINSVLDDDVATLLSNEFGVELNIRRETAAEEALISQLTKTRSGIESGALTTRPPTVAVLGHVDHGKTTLIDAIRESRVAAGEAGGITQHIGAYQVTTKKGHKLTVIDTPGHAAFTAMRARGAKAVDVVVLVVAADDGPMPQTEEALAHARDAKVPIVVALTKADKPEANIARAMQQISSRLGLHPEEYGGDIAMMPVSALKKEGVEELLERVFLEAEHYRSEERRCHAEGDAKGVVLEAEIHEGKGIVAHLLIQDGTLNRGDVILAGSGYGKVRSMHDDLGRVVEHATPSMPVEVTGLDRLPSVGETFYVVGALAQAKEVAEEREKKSRALQMATERRTLDATSLLKAVADKNRQSINVVVRADVQGSVEVLKAQLSQLKHAEVEVKVLHAGVGAVTESDVLLAAGAGGTVISFHASTNDKARVVAERENVAIRYYDVLYQLLDDMHALMEGMLAPEMREEITGHVEVRALFKSSKVGSIAGCMVLDGSIFRDSKVRVMRAGVKVHEGTLSSLKRVKDDVKEVREGFECGLTVRDFQTLDIGDVVESFRIIKVKRLLGERAPADKKSS